MENYNRSRSYGNNNGQVVVHMESYYGAPPPTMPHDDHDLRSYSSVSYAQSKNHQRGIKLKKGKSVSTKSWGFGSDPEFQRKKRVASYKMYSVEGKVKGSFRKSFRWLKYKYTQVLYGW
ncbi:hypothetical protein HN51_042160 [Arachis hypogaea]|uniref:DUF3511 domain protein n=3 Tax=Arachis TaxID=3817 RepID=A0A444YVS1_ARAHY|nr:uncharacterized protein LOC107495623 [Arachis duranensis]XP_025606699.1 uncharacterized protein LOC112697652 [Arachis hypogaea]QHN88030.1 uncharacterized protein DS421_16g560230 [Arachis hypogaea]RYR05996.1 hypothetical protein Ahy_B06g085803 isoform A [Arachis hypogaea]